MKKTLHEQIAYRQIRAKKLLRRRARKADRSDKQSNIGESLRLQAPKHLTLESKKYRRVLHRFLASIHSGVQRGTAKICLNFEMLESMGPHATIVLWAELNRIKKKCPDLRLSAIQPRNNKCLQVFSQIGLSKLLGCQRVPATEEDVVHWRAVSGKDVDGEKYAEQLMTPYLGKMDEEISAPLWIGVQEAMTNVVHHAYLFPRGDKLSRSTIPDEDWWMFSQEKDGFLTVLICDLGVGIPRTVPLTKRKSLAPVVRWMSMGERSDADILSAVLKMTVLTDKPRDDTATSSRTGEPNRGKGFYNIVKTVRSVPNSTVNIYSNRGRWRSHNQEEPAKSNFSTSIYGTIISWRIPVGAQHE